MLSGHQNLDTDQTDTIPALPTVHGYRRKSCRRRARATWPLAVITSLAIRSLTISLSLLVRALSRRVDQGRGVIGAAPGQADAGSAVAIVVDHPPAVWAWPFFEADLGARGPKAHAMPDDLDNAQAGVEGGTAGEDGLGGLQRRLPVPDSSQQPGLSAPDYRGHVCQVHRRAI